MFVFHPPGQKGALSLPLVSVNLCLRPAPKASWIPEAPRHFEESQWGPEERDGLYVAMFNEIRR